MELHFYPGQKLLIVKGEGVPKTRFEAWEVQVVRGTG